jgi:hypothetical protein
MSTFAQFRDVKVSIVTSLAFRRAAKALDAEYELYIEEEQKLLDIYAEKDDLGGFVRPMIETENGEMVPDRTKVNLNDEKGFNAALDELFAAEVTLDIPKIKLSALTNIDISMNELETVFFLIEDDMASLII